MIERSPQIDQKMEEKMSQIRESLIEQFPSQEEGIDRKRMESYFARLNLKTSELIFLNEEEKPKFLQATEEFKTMIPDYGSIYMPELHLSVVFRYKKAEEWNTAFITESIAIHELAHSTSQYRQFNVDHSKERIIIPRIGFTLREKGWGNFLEEAFAEYMRGIYVKEYIPTDLKDEILQRTSKKTSESNITMGTLLEWPIGGQQGFIIPRYLGLTENDVEVTTISSYAAMSIDLLKFIYPTIPDDLIKSRFNLERLRSFAQKVHKLAPGLYTTLQDLQYNSTDFLKGNVLVGEAVQRHIEKI